MRCPGGKAEQHRGIKLLVGRVKIHKPNSKLIQDLVDARSGAVDLNDDNDDSVTKLECARPDNLVCGIGPSARQQTG